MLNLHRLRLLHQFSLRHSISATAEATGYSASAVSQQLAVLEREVGAVLLERTPKTSRLSAAGELLAARAVDLLAAAEELESRLDELRRVVGGSLTVGAVPSLAVPVAARVAALVSTHPGLATSVRQTEAHDAVPAVSRGDLDVAVIDTWPGVGLPVPGGLVRLRLGSDALVLAGRPDAGAWAEDGDPGAALRTAVGVLPWICAPVPQPSRAYGDRLLARAGADPTSRWEFEGLHTQSALVAGGSGVAVLPASCVSGHVHTMPLGRSRAIVAVARRSQTRRPALRALTAELRAHPLV